MNSEIDGKKLLLEEIQKGNIKILNDILCSYNCNICECKISGHMQAQSHVAGTQHNKKVKQKQKEESNSAPAKKICLKDNTDHSGNKDTASTKEFFCSLCNVEVNGETPYLHHLSGQGHKKKLKNIETSRALGMSISDQASSSSSRPSCVSPVTSSTHPVRESIPPVRSNTQERVTPRVSPDVQSVSSNTSLLKQEEEKKYFCGACNIDLNGPVQYQGHIDGKSHKKKLNAIDARKSLECSYSGTSSRSSSRSSSPVGWVPANVQRTTVSPLTSECQLVRSLDLERKLNLHDEISIRDGELIIIGVDEPIPALF